MDGVVCDESKVALINARTANAPFNTLVMGLSQANITPSRTTVAGDLTPSEVSVTGYARQTVGTWGTPSLSSGLVTVNAAPVTFNNSGGSDSGTIYCWFFFDTATNKLVAAGRFTLPFVLAAGGSYTTTPFWRLNGDV